MGMDTRAVWGYRHDSPRGGSRNLGEGNRFCRPDGRRAGGSRADHAATNVDVRGILAEMPLPLESSRDATYGDLKG